MRGVSDLTDTQGIRPYVLCVHSRKCPFFGENPALLHGRYNIDFYQLSVLMTRKLSSGKKQQDPGQADGWKISAFDQRYAGKDVEINIIVTQRFSSTRGTI